MTSFDPGALGGTDWYIDQITNQLATAIADAAVDLASINTDNFEALLAVYHDACQLKAALASLKTRINDVAMREVMA